MADVTLPKGSVADYDLIWVMPEPIGKRRIGGAPYNAPNFNGPLSLDLRVLLKTDNVFTLDSNNHKGDTTGFLKFAAESMDFNNRIMVPVSTLGYEGIPDGAVDKPIQQEVEAGGNKCRVVESTSSLKIGGFVSLMDELKVVRKVEGPGKDGVPAGRVDVTFSPALLQTAPANTMLKIADPTGAYLSPDVERRFQVRRVYATVFFAGTTIRLQQYGPATAV